MANLNSSGSIGNIMSRLGGLKNVSGRRVMPGAEFLQNLEDVDTDVSGTAPELPNFANFVSPNQPEADLGGELTPQSYDVRANSVNSPSQEEPMEESGFFSKLGQALADYVNPQKREEVSNANRAMFNKQQAAPQTPPISTAQVDMKEGLPPVTASEQEYQGPQAPESTPGFFGAIQDYFSPTKRDEMSQYNKDSNQDLQLALQGKNPGEVRAQEQQKLTEDIQKSMEQPWQYSAYGAASEVANNPALQAEFKQITGIDYEPQIAAQISEHEAAMKGVEDSLNGINTQLDTQAEGIRQRILTNQSTDNDKFYIGLALLMPLLIGGFFGKEAALGALGGGAKGFADILGRRQKEIRDDETSLLDINKQKGSNIEKLANLGLERAKLGPNLRKNLPEDQNQHLIGLREKEWTDPTTGQPMKGIEIKPGLIARPEFVASKEGKVDMLKAANELSEVKTYVDELNDLTEDVANIVTQLKDPTAVWKGMTSILSKKEPTFLRKMTQDVMFDGRKQNAGVLLEEKLGFLANAYGMAKELGQLDRAAQNHIKKIIDNPTSSFLTPQDSLSQVLEIRKLAQRGLVRSAANKGFYPEFIVQDLESANNPLFGKLNRNDEKKQIADIEKKLSQNETNYAK